MQIKLLDVVNETISEFHKFSKAVDLITHVTTSKLFADKVMAAQFSETNGFSNAQILSMVDNAEPKITVRVYKSWWSKVVGYTYFKSNTIYVNRKYLGGLVGVASNLLHEVMHILNFGHAGKWSSSVPYTMNRIFEECCLQMDLKEFS